MRIVHFSRDKPWAGSQCGPFHHAFWHAANRAVSTLSPAHTSLLSIDGVCGLAAFVREGMRHEDARPCVAGAKTDSVCVPMLTLKKQGFAEHLHDREQRAAAHPASGSGSLPRASTTQSGGHRRIFDLVLFSEADRELVPLRIAELKDVVDFIVLAESEYRFSDGLPKRSASEQQPRVVLVFVRHVLALALGTLISCARIFSSTLHIRPLSLSTVPRPSPTGLPLMPRGSRSRRTCATSRSASQDCLRYATSRR